MTARAYFVHGVQLVNTGGEMCEMCEACGERKAVGRSIRGHVLCQRCAGLHSELAEELAQEVEASKARRASAYTSALTRARTLAAEGERVTGDTKRRARGAVNGGAARRNNTATPSPRAAYDRQHYVLNREKKIAQVKAAQAKKKRRVIRTYRDTGDAS